MATWRLRTHLGCIVQLCVRGLLLRLDCVGVGIDRLSCCSVHRWREVWLLLSSGVICHHRSLGPLNDRWLVTLDWVEKRILLSSVLRRIEGFNVTFGCSSDQILLLQISYLNLDDCTIRLLRYMVGRFLSSSPRSRLLIEWVLNTICRAPSMLALAVLVSLTWIATCHIWMLLLGLLRNILSGSVFVAKLRHF